VGDWQCLEELDGDDEIVPRYTYAPGYIDAVAVQERDLNADNDFADDDEVVYYHSSTLFGVYALSDASESVIERYRYDAYGACTVLDADGSVDGDGLSDVDNPYLFTARRLDPESGLMYYRFRDYSPGLGRFVQRDPAAYTASLKLYGYLGGAPLNAVDPLGLWEKVLFRRSQDRELYSKEITIERNRVARDVLGLVSADSGIQCCPGEKGYWASLWVVDWYVEGCLSCSLQVFQCDCVGLWAYCSVSLQCIGHSFRQWFEVS